MYQKLENTVTKANMLYRQAGGSEEPLETAFAEKKSVESQIILNMMAGNISLADARALLNSFKF